MKNTQTRSCWFTRNWVRAALVASLFVVAASPAAAEEAPKIVSTQPSIGATGVDPALKEITVKFDQDMAEGMSWTGGGAEFPILAAGAQGHWVDQRTCVLPVMLQPGHQYRVGINSPSYRNFRSQAGVPVAPTAVTFSTRGGASGAKARVPKIIAINPRNGTNNVNPELRELRVTFDVPMGEGCSWTGGGPQFPTIPDGQKPFWTDDHKTCVLPVELKPNQTYMLGLNSPSHKNFRSAEGIPLPPIGYTFQTGANQ
jgi:hypothetical protein